LRFRIHIFLLVCVVLACTARLYAGEPVKLKVGLYENAPKIFTDRDGKPAGLLVELLHEIARAEHWEIQYIHCVWAECLESLRAGGLDLMPDVAYTDARAELFSFPGVPVLHSWSQVYRLPGMSLKGVPDLAEKKITVLRGSSQANVLRSILDGHGIAAKIIPVDSLKEGFKAVAGGQADATVANHFFGALHASEFGLVDAPIVFQPASLFFAAPKNRHPKVLAALDRRLAALQSNPDSVYFEIVRTWRPEAGIYKIPSSVRWGIAVVIGLLLSSLATSIYLRRKVTAHTRDLKESERKLTSILESVESLIYIKDSDYRYTYVNRAVCDLFGRPSEEILGKRDADLLDPETAAVLLEGDRKIIDGGVRITVEEVTGEADDRERRTFLSTKIPLTSTDGQTYALCGISTDITDRKKTEDSLRIAAAVFRSQEGMFVTGQDRRLLNANDAFLKMMGFRPEDLIGKTLPVVTIGDRPLDGWPAIWQQVQQHGQWQGEVWARRKDLTRFPAWLTLTVVRDDKSRTTHYVGTQTDVTEQHAAQHEITRLAYFDPLTGLPNRSLLLERMRHSLTVQRRSAHASALLFIDLDNFKDLNDTRGHETGDNLLRQVGGRILGCCRENDTVARFGGDEFVVLLEDIGLSEQEATAYVRTVGHKILAAIASPFTVNGMAYRCTCSIGAYVYGTPDLTIEDLMRRGDLAMYEAKRAGRNILCLFNERIEHELHRRTSLEAQLQEGLDKDQFRLHFQAQFDVHGRVVGAEALLRWEQPGRGMVSPGEFIEVAEKTGLILPLGDWVMAKACQHLSSWSKSGLPQLPLAVNVSATQLRRPDFVERTLTILEEKKVDPCLLKIELTESMLIEDIEDTISKMRRLKARGVGFSLDDFGTGYSSLSYLKQLPLDQLKIDRSFVRDVLTDANDAAIAKSIVALGKSLDLSLVAEGVELHAQHEFLVAEGCDFFQGYLYARPTDEAGFRALVERGSAVSPAA
jgi:diguanylate cyclase (GGDEF)-like protein/PAS domain S-box-containing protein